MRNYYGAAFCWLKKYKILWYNTSSLNRLLRSGGSMLRGFYSRLQPFFDTDNDGGDNNNSQGNDNPPANADKDKKLPETAEQAFRRLVDGKFNGDYEAAALHLYDDNYRVRQAKKLVETERDTLLGNTQRDGAVVLSKEDSAAWRDYKKLGSVTDVKTWLDERRTLQGDLAKKQKDETLREVAEVTNFNLNVLRRVGNDLDYRIEEVVDAQDPNKKTKLAKVRATATVNGQQVVTELDVSKYAADNWSDLMPALTATTNGNGQAQKGQRYIQQVGVNQQQQQNGNTQSVAKGVLGSRYAPKPKE